MSTLSTPELMAQHEALMKALQNHVAASKPSKFLSEMGHSIDQKLFSIFEDMYLIARLDQHNGKENATTENTIRVCKQSIKSFFEEFGIGEQTGEELMKKYDRAIQSALNDLVGKSATPDAGAKR